MTESILQKFELFKLFVPEAIQILENAVHLETLKARVSVRAHNG
jgi:hypothetical protein